MGIPPYVSIIGNIALKCQVEAIITATKIVEIILSKKPEFLAILS